jgi:hypothetical protein
VPPFPTLSMSLHSIEWYVWPTCMYFWKPRFPLYMQIFWFETIIWVVNMLSVILVTLVGDCWGYLCGCAVMTCNFSEGRPGWGWVGWVWLGHVGIQLSFRLGTAYINTSYIAQHLRTCHYKTSSFMCQQHHP